MTVYPLPRCASLLGIPAAHPRCAGTGGQVGHPRAGRPTCPSGHPKRGAGPKRATKNSSEEGIREEWPIIGIHRPHLEILLTTSPIPHPNTSLKLWIVLLFSILVGVMGTLWGYRYGDGNQIEQLPIVMRAINPTYLANDFFTNVTQNAGPRAYFADFVARLARLLPRGTPQRPESRLPDANRKRGRAAASCGSLDCASLCFRGFAKAREDGPA